MNEPHPLGVLNGPMVRVVGGSEVGVLRSRAANREVTVVMQVTQERAIVVIRGETCFERDSGKSSRCTGCGR